MMPNRLPKSWRQRIARAGLMLGALSLMTCGVSFGADATTAAEEAKQRLSGGSIAPIAPTYGINQVSMQEAAPAPLAPACAPEQVFSDCGDGCGSWKEKLKDGKGIDVGGWVAAGYASNPDLSFIGANENGKFHANQVYGYVQKVADGSEGIDFGFRFDAIYGIDGNDTQSFGNNPGNWDYLNGFDHGIYEWALPQAYAEVAFNEKLSVKVGHFYTIIGYEVVTTPDNFFFSKQINFYNSEPFTHTGALATYKATDKLTAYGGYVYGWDTGFDQFQNGNSFLGGLTYAANDKLTLTWTNATGDFGWRGNGVINSFVGAYKITEKVSYVTQFDVLGTTLQQDGAVPATLFDAATPAFLAPVGDSIGYINYLFYEVNSKVKVGTRLEWYKPDGASFYEMTYGVNYKPIDNFVVRPEIRYQWAPAYDYEETIFGIDAVYKF